MPADKSKITDALWEIVEEQTTRLRQASKGRDLTGDEHDALANIARVTRTLSLHDPGEDAYLPAKDAEELREALRLLQEGENE